MRKFYIIILLLGLSQTAFSQFYAKEVGMRGGYTAGITFRVNLEEDLSYEAQLGYRDQGAIFTLIRQQHLEIGMDPVGNWEFVYGFGAHTGFYFTDTYRILFREVYFGREIFTPVFGLSIYATTAVLCAFMGGLGMGSYIAPRVINKWGKSFWSLYALLELGIGLGAVLIPFSTTLITSIYVSVSVFSQSGPLTSLVRFMLALIVMFIPTFFMGLTLPVLIHAFRRFSAEDRISSRRIGLAVIHLVLAVDQVADGMRNRDHGVDGRNRTGQVAVAEDFHIHDGLVGFHGGDDIAARHLVADLLFPAHHDTFSHGVGELGHLDYVGFRHSHPGGRGLPPQGRELTAFLQAPVIPVAKD